ncbi:2-dehydropantoate 2-reductase [Anaerolineales bacterium HSG24]|nr:2-dehydropantoate 2-reductase [Anaerolineales bacterium HSG24]
MVVKIAQAKPLNITIFGIGALGTLFGSHLNSVAQVTLFGHWPAQFAALRRDGLSMTHPDGHQSHHRLTITNQLQQIPTTDLALVLVKSHQTAQVAQQAVRVLHLDGLVLTLQNGLGNYEQLADIVGSERTTLGITAQGATMTAPGQLLYAGTGPTHLTRSPTQADRLTIITELFNRAGLPTMLVDQADSLVWGKLAINAGINPLTSLLELPNGALVEPSKYQTMMITAALEVAQVAKAQGIELPYPDVAQRVIDVCLATATNHSSMLQDIKRGASTEIEAICGQVVKHGQRLGVPTPMNVRLLTLVQAKERGENVEQALTCS